MPALWVTSSNQRWFCRSSGPGPNLDVRETQSADIELYESLGFRRWGTHPSYALAQGKRIAGHYYYKDLSGSEAAS